MKIVKNQVKILTKDTQGEILELLELAGRTCYKSEDKIGPGTAVQLIQNIMKNHHESVLEHKAITVKCICDRAIANELVRHRIASYSQESTRYVNYRHKKHGEQISVIKPILIKEGTTAYKLWENATKEAEKTYFSLLKESSPEIARSVLPLCTKTEIVVTMNIRSWRNFFQLRLDKAAHPDMRDLAEKIFKEFNEKYPIFFEDLKNEKAED